MRLTPLLLTLLAAPAFAGDDSNWPRFRGPDGTSIAPDSASPPVEWDGASGKNVAWQTPLPGPGSSSPVVWGDAVFLTCYTGYGTESGGGFNAQPEAGSSPDDLVRHLLRLDRESGEIVWTASVPAGDGEGDAEPDEYRGFISEHGYATSTPVTDGERVYVLFGKSGVLAYDFGGNELWRQSVGTESGPRGWGSGASPILYEDKAGGSILIVNASEESQSVRGLDPATGEQLWMAEAAMLEQSWTTPIVRTAAADSPHPGRAELLLPVPDELWGMDPATGKVLWYAEIPVDGSACTSPVAADGTAYVVGGRQGGSAAVRLGGSGDVTETARAWTSRNGSYVPSPVLLPAGYGTGDAKLPAARLFWFTDQGLAFAVDPATGAATYRARMPGGGRTGAYASPVAAAGKLFVLTRDGDTHVVTPGDTLRVDRVNSLGPEAGRCNATPAVSGDSLFVRSDRFAWRLAAE